MKKGMLSFFIFAVIILLCSTFLLIRSQRDLNQKSTPQWISQKDRELANKLRGVGLFKEAAQAYERYLDESRPSPEQWSKIAFMIGQTYMDAKEYEKALQWFYQVELTDPETGLSSKVGPQIISCLERLGRYSAAEYALESRTSLDSGDSKKGDTGGEIIAKIGEDEIYQNHIDQALDALPPWVKKEFSDPEKKKEFAKQFIAEELLYRKGIKLGYEKDPEIQKTMERFRRQLVIANLRKKEIEEELAIDEADVKNYFLANQGKYTDPNQKESSAFEDIKERVASDYREQKIQQGYQRLLRQALTGTDVHLYLENLN